MKKWSVTNLLKKKFENLCCCGRRRHYTPSPGNMRVFLRNLPALTGIHFYIWTNWVTYMFPFFLSSESKAVQKKSSNWRPRVQHWVPCGIHYPGLTLALWNSAHDTAVAAYQWKLYTEDDSNPSSYGVSPCREDWGGYHFSKSDLPLAEKGLPADFGHSEVEVP